MSKNKLAIPRLTHFVAMLKENRYPNHPALVREMRMLDIAGAYSITQKTLQRDVAFLRGDYGAPIAYDYQRRGYYLTDPSWTWDIPQLNDSDLDTALIAARLAESIMPAPFGENTRKAVDALLSNSERTVNHTDILLSLIARGAGIPIKPEIFSVVFSCWRNRRVLLAGYSRGMDGESSELSLEPHVLAFYEGGWYIRVRVRQSSNPLMITPNVITLALHRITHVVSSPIQFEADKEIIDSVQANGIFDFPKIKEIKLRAKGKGLRVALEAFKPKIIAENKDGSKVIAVENIEEYKIINFVFAWAGDLTVISPEVLRKHVILCAESVMKLHKGVCNEQQ